MIDFRYHVVSIVAVFLALALGLVLGSTALRGPVLNNLSGNVGRLTAENQNLRQQVHDAQTLTGRQGDFAAKVAPTLLRNSLAGRSVAVLSLPGASTDQQKQVRSYLKAAGAQSPVVLQFNAGFFDPQRGAEIKDLVAQLLPAGVTIPTSADGVTQGAALLGAVLTAKQKGGAVSAGTRTSVLNGFANLGLLTIEGTPAGPSDEAVVIAAPSDASNGAAAALKAEVSGVRQLDRTLGETVVAAPTGPNTLVSAVRSDSALGAKVSTVDNLDSPVGQVDTVLALVAERRGSTGAYGTGSGTTAVPARSLR